MSAQEKLIYGADVLLFLLFGLLTPLAQTRNQTIISGELIAIGFAKAPLVVLLVVIFVAVLSAATMYISVLAVRSQLRSRLPFLKLFIVKFFLPLFKLFIIGLPAIAVGYVAAITLGWLRLGPYEAAWKGWPFLAVGAVSYLCGGIGGIVAMKSKPRWRQGT